MEAELDTHFRSLKTFVRATEAAAVAAAKAAGAAVATVDDAGRPVPPRIPEGVPVVASVPDVEALLRDFASAWRQGLKNIHDGVLRHFPDARHGMGVLKAVMGAFVGLYERFQQLLGRAFPPSAPFLREVVPTPTM